MALETGFVLAQESSAAAFEGLRKVSPAAFDRRSLVRVVAVGATNFSFENRMVMRQGKLRAHLGVALKTRCRRFARIDDRMRAAAALDVQTSRPVTRFAADVLGVVSFRL